MIIIQVLITCLLVCLYAYWFIAYVMSIRAVYRYLCLFIYAGFNVYDDCGILRNAMARALDILDEPVLGSLECNASLTACNIGKFAYSFIFVDCI